MPITTKSEVKELLQIASSDTSKDTLIDYLIIKVQDFIVRRINNFVIPEIFVQGDGIFFDADVNKIFDAESQFDSNRFAVGNDIIVLGSFQNDKVFSIKSITEDAIEVNETIVDETAGELIFIRRIQFTEDIKLAAVDFIAGKLNKEKSVKSRTLGDYSETFLTQQEMLDVFSPFKKLQWD